MTLSIDLITGIVSFIVTLLILSYLLGDNPLFRIAAYIFTGVSAGYVAVVALWQVLWPKLFLPILFGTSMERVYMVMPLLGFGLILMRMWPRLSKLGSPAMAYLAGAAAAAAISGAVTGTLLPQVSAAINAFDPLGSAGFFDLLINGSIVLVGTVTSLAYFHFGAHHMADGSVRRFIAIEMLAWAGRIFAAIALGVIFAGVYSAALTALIERASSMIYFIRMLSGIL